MNENILIVEDNVDMLELLEIHLSSKKYNVVGLLSTKNIKTILSTKDIDLIIMDRGLPDIEGSDYMEMLRHKNINIPIILLSAKNSPKDIKEGFLKGADDYVTKPFDMEEFLLRVQAVLRRSNKEYARDLDVIKYRDITLNLNTHETIVDSIAIALTNLEIKLLQILIENKGKVLDREYLLQHAWKKPEAIRQKSINVAIKRLKEKIDPSTTKQYIRAVRGVGYIID